MSVLKKTLLCILLRAPPESSIIAPFCPTHLHMTAVYCGVWSLTRWLLRRIDSRERTVVMSKWWRKVQEALPKPSSLKKTARKNVSFVQKYGERANNVPESVRVKSAQLRKQARERAEEAASRLAGSARALPSKAAEVREARERERVLCYISFKFQCNTTADGIYVLVL